MKSYRIGDSSPRVDLSRKLAGRAKYVDDLVMPGMLHGMTVRSTIARGRLNNIMLPEPPPGLVIADSSDIPGDNIVLVLNDDQPLLAVDRINHPLEPLLLVAHEDRETLLRFMNGIELDQDGEVDVLELEDSMSGNVVIHRDGNLLKEIDIAKGDPDPVWDQAHLVLDGQYRTGAQEQAYIEPQGVIAWTEDGRICVRGSMQCPYYVHKVMCGIFALPGDRIRVIQDPTGGGFGGKEEYPSILAAHAALLALKSGRPVKMVYDRAEDMAATTKRHPSLSRIRAAFDPGGRLLAQDIEFNLDAGAYTTLTPVVLSRGALHASGPYRCDHVRIKARAWATNLPPHGAFRGFGAPQSCFAIETLMDQAADKLGLDPAEIRRINLLRSGDTTATGQRMNEQIDLAGLLDKALTESGYLQQRKTNEEHNSKAGPEEPRRGIGLSTFFHGAGFTGAGERLLRSRAGLELMGDGTLVVQAASTEIGQGAITVFTQIVCDTLGVDPGRVRVEVPDTDKVPDSGPTVASRTTMVVGSLVRDAAKQLEQKLLEAFPEMVRRGDMAAALDAMSRQGPLRCEGHYQHPDWVVWDEDEYKGDAYPTYAWAVYVASTELDPLTAEVRVTDFLALQDVGRVVNPQLAEGQVEGGVAQGIGFALLEEVAWREGRMANNRLSDYILPTTMDLPVIRVLFRETPWGYGPEGAKGLGELPMDGTAPAVMSALSQAAGFRPTWIPALPESLLSRMEDEAAS